MQEFTQMSYNNILYTKGQWSTLPWVNSLYLFPSMSSLHVKAEIVCSTAAGLNSWFFEHLSHFLVLMQLSSSLQHVQQSLFRYPHSAINHSFSLWPFNSVDWDISGSDGLQVHVMINDPDPVKLYLSVMTLAVLVNLTAAAQRQSRAAPLFVFFLRQD